MKTIEEWLEYMPRFGKEKRLEFISAVQKDSSDHGPCITMDAMLKFLDESFPRVWREGVKAAASVILNKHPELSRQILKLKCPYE